MIKRILYILAAVITLSIFSPVSNAQSGWQAGQYYQYQGQIIKEYDPYYSVMTPLGIERRYRILQWERQSYSGYIYVWNGWGWVTQWQNSWAWYCWWSNWYYELR
jgi:hypothetical protein